MKRISLTLAGLVIITACATGPTTYAPIGDSRTGYFEQPIEDDRIRVGFAARSVEEAQDFALLRAAEIADERGYPYFEVIGGGTEVDGRRAGGSNLGVGVGSGGYRGTSVGVGLGLDLGSLGGQVVTHTIEVKLRDSDNGMGDVYSTRSILETVGARS